MKTHLPTRNNPQTSQTPPVCLDQSEETRSLFPSQEKKECDNLRWATNPLVTLISPTPPPQSHINTTGDKPCVYDNISRHLHPPPLSTFTVHSPIREWRKLRISHLIFELVQCHAWVNVKVLACIGVNINVTAVWKLLKISPMVDQRWYLYSVCILWPKCQCVIKSVSPLFSVS